MLLVEGWCCSLSISSCTLTIGAYVPYILHFSDSGPAVPAGRQILRKLEFGFHLGLKHECAQSWSLVLVMPAEKLCEYVG